MEVIVHFLDSVLGKELTNVIFDFYGSFDLEFHVTRSIVLARPSFVFAHISVFNVVLESSCVRFLVAADVEHCFVFFELSIFFNFEVLLVETRRVFPFGIVTANDRAQFFADFVRRSILRKGLFCGSSSCKTFDVVACDGIGTPQFCPGFNMFRIKNKHSLSVSLHKLDPKRFAKQISHMSFLSFASS